ncbi:sensor histidine kinase [Paenibacillus pasadenensis]|uniref:histidine kinase n=1 Tax=Paenibacillus pasadenensis TaxID=217090 RepID=A0A2N5N000_9BACL|nr:ATP-binding protein [Paenibacillus pasadenensis]PLT43632.1 sensor histidine kinase [Paenibacillus pasadenensis]
MTLKTKLSLFISLLVGLMLLFHLAFSDVLIRKELARQYERFTKSVADQTVKLFSTYRSEGASASPGRTPEELLPLIVQYEPQILEIGIWRMEDGGAPLLVEGTSGYFDDETGKRLLRESAQAMAQAEVPDTDIMRTSYPFALDGVPYRISLAVERIDIDHLSGIHARNELIGAAGIFLVLMGLIWLIIRSVLRPLRAIVRKVGDVAEGRFDTPLEAEGRDELSQLARRVKVMSHNLLRHTGELRAASEENERIKDQLESIIQNTADSIVIIGLDFRLLKVNRAFCQMFGYTEEEALCKDIRELVHPQHSVYEEAELARLVSGELLPPAEEEWRHRCGTYIRVSCSLNALRDAQGEAWGFVSVVRDISSRSQMEELLLRSEKLTTVGQLAAGVAHEIRNPLTTLRGFLQLQQETGKLSLRHNDIMLAELDRINLIVGEFLILAKPQAARFQVKDVRYVLGDVISLLDSEGHLKNAVFHTRFTREPCLVSCEENQLKQVFINIIKNAIEAMPAGGNVTFDIDHPHEGEVAICITDEGVGIPEDIIPRIGDPFFTAKETGTGLGIMVSQRIIQSHKGSMRIASKLGEGTSVTVLLPAYQGEAE